jgi:tetratricopeptide (TPR) repeat protein
MGVNLLLNKAAILFLMLAVLQPHAAAQQTATDRLIRSLGLQASLQPQDPASYDKLGAAYIQKGRETADASYYELGRQALLKSLDLVSNGPAAASATTHMALVFMAEHRFQEALTWAEQALELGSGDPTPWGIVGDALTDLGEYDRAEGAYTRLRDPVNPQDPPSALTSTRDSRLSYLKFLRGDGAGAVQLMRGAIRAAVEAHLPLENIAWEYYQLGDESFRGGDVPEAERAYQQGLAVSPQNYRCLAGLAQVRAAQERFAEASELYKQALAVVPFPEYAAALGDICVKSGHPEEAKKQYDLVEFIGYLNAINKVLYNRELALFYADHDIRVKESLELARRELEVRHDIYTWDTLAWSYYRNNRLHDAGDAVAKALRLGTQDPQIFFHAGMIYHRLGDKRQGKAYLERALAISSHFHVFYAEEARKVLRETSERAESEIRTGGRTKGRAL